jgi:hypothetical protein
MRTVAQTATRDKKLSTAGLNCYLISGVTMKFLCELEKFSTSYYYKRGIKGDLDWFLDMSRDKVLDMLPLYEPSKGPLVPFIFSCLRNRGSSVSRRENRKVPESQLTSLDLGTTNDNKTDNPGGALDGLEGREMVADTLSFHSLQVRADKLGLLVLVDKVAMNLKEEILTPMTKVYSWLYLKGEL